MLVPSTKERQMQGSGLLLYGEAMGEKRCRECKQVKQLTEFRKDKGYKNGYRGICRKCWNAARRERYKANFDKISSYAKEWYKANSEKIKKSAQEWKKNNPDKVALMIKGYRNRYPEKYKAREIVNYAVQAGKIPPAKTLDCSECGQQAKDYHHYKGYAEENWLDIVPLCKKCHAVADKTH